MAIECCVHCDYSKWDHVIYDILKKRPDMDAVVKLYEKRYPKLVDSHHYKPNLEKYLHASKEEKAIISDPYYDDLPF